MTLPETMGQPTAETVEVDIEKESSLEMKDKNANEDLEEETVPLAIS